MGYSRTTIKDDVEEVFTPAPMSPKKVYCEKKPGQNRLRQIKSVSPSNKVCIHVTSSIGVDTPTHYPRKHSMLTYICFSCTLKAVVHGIMYFLCCIYFQFFCRRSRSGYLLYVYLSGTPPRSKLFVNLLAEGTNGLIHCYVFKQRSCFHTHFIDTFYNYNRVSKLHFCGYVVCKVNDA